jgi:FlaA1/EpsC-like NDP-sugar epimerase
MRARRLGLTASRLPSLDEGREALQLTPVAVEDLLLRPSVKIDYRRLEDFVKGRSVVVTGGGGSIGAEICDRVVTFGAGRLMVIENSEPALYAVLETLSPSIRRRGSKAGSPTYATASACFTFSRISSPTSCSTPRLSSTCRCSSRIGARA